MTCKILTPFAPDSVRVNEAWAVTLTTIPLGVPVSWSGDLEFHETVQLGHQILAKWQTPGSKFVQASCEGDSIIFVVAVTEQLAERGDDRGGERGDERGDDGGDERQPLPPIIIECPEMSAENRAFNPHSLDEKIRLSGQIRLCVRVPNPLDGGRIRWSVSKNKDDQFGRVRFLVKSGGSTVMANEAEGETVEVLCLDPGHTAVDVEVRNAIDQTVQSQKFQLMVPQFVTVDVARIEFDAFLLRVGLVGFKKQIVGEAKATSSRVLSEANVRLIWLGDDPLPAHLLQDLVTQATIVDLAPPDPTVLDVYGETFDRLLGKSLVGPAEFDERLFVYPGSFTNPSVTHLDEPVAPLVEKALQGSPDLTVKVVGRLIGATLGHEILHSLFGFFVFEQVDASLADHLSGTKPKHKGDIMLRTDHWTFSGATGILITDPDKFPAESSFADLGIGFILKPKSSGGSLIEIERTFPVPPAFQ